VGTRIPIFLLLLLLLREVLRISLMLDSRMV